MEAAIEFEVFGGGIEVVELEPSGPAVEAPVSALPLVVAAPVQQWLEAAFAGERIRPAQSAIAPRPRPSSPAKRRSPALYWGLLGMAVLAAALA